MDEAEYGLMRRMEQQMNAQTEALQGILSELSRLREILEYGVVVRK